MRGQRGVVAAALLVGACFASNLQAPTTAGGPSGASRPAVTPAVTPAATPAAPDDDVALNEAARVEALAFPGTGLAEAAVATAADGGGRSTGEKGEVATDEPPPAPPPPSADATSHATPLQLSNGFIYDLA